MIVVRPAPKDTIIVDWSDDKFRVIPDQPPIPAGGRAGGASAGTGLLVDEIRLVTDFDEFKTEGGFGAGNQGEFAPEDDWELGRGLGFDGVTFVADTAVYQFYSAELDRTPSLVFMPQPEYPPLARRAGVEGNVLVWVLVEIIPRWRATRLKVPGSSC